MMAAKKSVKKTPAKAGSRKVAKWPLQGRSVDIPPPEAIQPQRGQCLSAHQIMEDLAAHPGKDKNDIEGLVLFYRDMLERLRPAVEAGSGEAMIEALELASFLMPAEILPEWFANQLQKAVLRYTGMEVRSLDQAFNLKERNGFAKKSKKARFGMRAFFDVCCLSAVGVGIDNDMHLEISKVYPKGVGRDMIKRFYEDELRRRGGQKYACRVKTPEQLPQRLHPVYEVLTGNRIRIQS